MSLYISSLNSGSNGNCYYIGNRHEAVLIDAGISCRETEKRIDRSGLSFNKIKAVFISHEHSDHIRGAEFIARKHQIPVYISHGTLQNSRLNLSENLVSHFTADTPVTIGSLVVNAFAKLHDAAEPHSFTVSGNGITIGILTDIGVVCDNVVANFRKCHAAFLEANYDEEMLENGRYPLFLKNRIRGGQGHLSNIQALELFKSHRPEFMSHLLLSHLSQDNNDPILALNLFAKHAGDTHISLASRYKESKVYSITGRKDLPDQWNKTIKEQARSVQMKLF